MPARGGNRGSRRSGAFVEIENSVLKTHIEYTGKSKLKLAPLAANAKYFNYVAEFKK